MVNNQKENPVKSIKNQVFIGVLEDYSDFFIFPFSEFFSFIFRVPQFFVLVKSKEFKITETLDKLIAAAAIIGLSNPKAASGIPIIL